MTRKLTKEYIQTRTKFIPEIGQIYENEGGGKYRCTGYYGKYFRDEPIMENILSGWTLIAHGVGIYEDGKIDWDYSTGGRFKES